MGFLLKKIFKKNIMKRKGILLAGGSGTRLFPVTKVISKQLLPIHDKPMIYYSLSTLMMAGIREVIIISTARDINFFKDLFGDGADLGMKFEYAVQKKPEGIAQSIIIAEKFLKKSPFALMLGDNIFYGNNFSKILKKISSRKNTTVFAYHVKDPGRYGVVESDKKGNAISLEEKPKKPKSNFAVTGLYFYNNSAIKVAKNLKPSARNELEITDLNKFFLKNKKLKVEYLNRGFAWLDAGTFESFYECSQLISAIEKRQDIKIGCIEEIAFNNKWINKDDLKKKVLSYGKSEYGNYLKKIIK